MAEMTSRWNRPGVWFGVFVIALAAVLLANVLVVDFGRSSVSRGDGPQILDDRVVTVREVQAGPGDVVRVHPAVSGQAFDRYEFYAVEHGEGEAYLAGGTAAHVYAQASGSAAAGTHDSTPLYVVRPDAPAGQASEWLDLVWVVHYADGVTPPASGEARTYFENWVRALGVSNTPQVTTAEAASFHAYVGVPLIVLLSLGVVGTGVWWARGFIRPTDESFQADEQTASGVTLVDLGGRYLAFVRALVIGVGLPLLYVAWVTLFFFANQVVETPGPGAGWGSVVMAGVYVVLVAVVAGWAATTWRVQRSHRRWRQLMAQRPIDV